MALAFGMAALTGICAQVRVHLPFTDVPVTGQTFAVLLAGAVLGTGYGGLSQVLYVTLGAAGLPWFTYLSGGSGVLAGGTGGYLVGFILAAALVGRVCDRSVAARRFWPQLGVMGLASALILACGWVHLAFVLGRGPWLALLQGVAPFLPGDALKAVMAAGVSTALLPKAQYHDTGRPSR
jgi:biotin transport system substrate-specific component